MRFFTLSHFFLYVAASDISDSDWSTLMSDPTLTKCSQSHDPWSRCLVLDLDDVTKVTELCENVTLKGSCQRKVVVSQKVYFKNLLSYCCAECSRECLFCLKIGLKGVTMYFYACLNIFICCGVWFKWFQNIGIYCRKYILSFFFFNLGNSV